MEIVTRGVWLYVSQEYFNLIFAINILLISMPELKHGM